MTPKKPAGKKAHRFTQALMNDCARAVQSIVPPETGIMILLVEGNVDNPEVNMISSFDPKIASDIVADFHTSMVPGNAPDFGGKVQ